MPEKTLIGLTELIAQVKRDLLATEDDGVAGLPIFSVDEVTLELQVTVRVDTNGKLKIYVLELGGGGSRDDVQKIAVKLTPLIDKQERIRLYRAQYPDLWRVIEQHNLRVGMKGDASSSNDTFGG